MGLFRKKRELHFDDEDVKKEIEALLGPHDSVFHSVVSFDLGHDIGGGSDVHVFENHIDGFVYVTSDLIGKKQKKSDANNYELMICHRSSETKWGINLISILAYYTLQASIFSNETMELEGGPFYDEDFTIRHILFHKYADFTVENNKLGLMLLIGITQQEWEWAQQNSTQRLLEILKEKNVFPYTDLQRESVI